MSDEPKTLSPLMQAVDELALMKASPADVIEGLVDSTEDLFNLCTGAAVSIVSDEEPPDALAWATAAVMFGIGLGVRAERVRQRRDGDHPGEAVA